MKWISIILVFCLVLIASCSGGYIVKMSDKTKFPEGRELFVSKCAGCHQLYNPDQFTLTEWDSLLFIMKRKAKIGEDQKNEIYNWILEIKENDSTSSEAASK